MRLDQSSMDISTLVAKVTSGEIDLQPDFQRGQVWSDSKKKRLVDTILRRWYVPAIHIIVNDDLDSEEVLDGQQRLRTILEFMEDKFTVDGKIEPVDSEIVRLSGLYYSQLPDAVKSKFRRFTVTTVRLRDYEPEEPGELFFRLNQLTALTAAEQRNALVGEPRNQVRQLANNLESKFQHKPLGFSNARMNFDDVLSRLALYIEINSLFEKVTASRLERRYRQGQAFSSETTSSIQYSITKLSDVYMPEWQWKQNKATLFSWLYFICDNDWVRHDIHNEVLSSFFNGFEAGRSNAFTGFEYLSDPSTPKQLYVLFEGKLLTVCSRIFNDRASSRVNDVTSVVLRDICLNTAFCAYAPPDIRQNPYYVRRGNVLSDIAKIISEAGSDLDFGEQSELEFKIINIWEHFNEARQVK